MYNSNCVFIAPSCSTGIIPNTDYVIEILTQQIEVATTTAFNLMHENSEAAAANYLMTEFLMLK